MEGIAEDGNEALPLTFCKGGDEHHET